MEQVGTTNLTRPTGHHQLGARSSGVQGPVPPIHFATFHQKVKMKNEKCKLKNKIFTTFHYVFYVFISKLYFLMKSFKTFH
jgi:hypothetical protein